MNGYGELPLSEEAISLCSQLEVLLHEETDTPAFIDKVAETEGVIVN